MPKLLNVRQERFAQEIAKGTSTAKAYVVAGYRHNPGNASNLRRKKHVSTRVADLQDKALEIDAKTTQMAAEAVSIDKAWVMRGLIDDRQAAREAQQYANAIRALELLGKELGMFIDRKEVKRVGEIERLDDEALAERIALLSERLALVAPRSADEAESKGLPN